MKHPVDIHVGKRIRQRRLLLNTNQQQLSDQVGVNYQQVQKYETGMNRVSASRLWVIAKVLNVPVSFFFEGLNDQPLANTRKSDFPVDIMTDKEALELLRAYYTIPENQRRRLFDLARALSEAA
ncbi:helix-turn-helix domain-containing protein [Pseudogemmobacter sp. W21_MBD1_M6]|uniref:helix-turn-helix domain-containing protein n=1 Tax=Pseudogemmobacter sp. W21_MBD1_M6 TaxID=3240271 RepID=UPI003F9AE9CA